MFFLCLFVKSSCRFALGKIVGHMRTQTHVAEQASYLCMIDFVCSLFVHLFLSPLSLFLSLSQFSSSYLVSSQSPCVLCTSSPP